MSSSSKSASTSTETVLAEDTPLAGLINPPINLFVEIRQVQKLVAPRSAEPQAGRTNNQYLVFLRVTNAQPTKMDQQRAKIGKHETHYTDTGDLIIKSSSCATYSSRAVL